MNITEAIAAAEEAYANHEEETTFEWLTIPVRQVRKGDTVEAPANYKVTDTKWGNTKFSVFVQGRKSAFRYDLGEEITIGRYVETEESKATTLALLIEVQALKFIAGAATGPSEADLKKYEEAQEQQWWSRVADYAIDFAGQVTVQGEFLNAVAAVESGRVTGTEALQEIKERFTEALVNNQNSPTWSGGFSATNAVNQATQEAQRTALRSMQYVIR